MLRILYGKDICYYQISTGSSTFPSPLTWSSTGQWSVSRRDRVHLSSWSLRWLLKNVSCSDFLCQVWPYLVLKKFLNNIQEVWGIWRVSLSAGMLCGPGQRTENSAFATKTALRQDFKPLLWTNMIISINRIKLRKAKLGRNIYELKKGFTIKSAILAFHTEFWGRA